MLSGIIWRNITKTVADRIGIFPEHNDGITDQRAFKFGSNGRDDCLGWNGVWNSCICVRTDTVERLPDPEVIVSLSQLKNIDSRQRAGKKLQIDLPGDRFHWIGFSLPERFGGFHCFDAIRFIQVSNAGFACAGFDFYLVCHSG